MAQFQDQKPGLTRQTGTGDRDQEQVPRTFALGEQGEIA